MIVVLYFYVIRLITSYDAFHERFVGIRTIEHVRRYLLMVLFLQKIQLFRNNPHGQNFLSKRYKLTRVR
uniref:Uncharacterized protein n=1 Tax=Lepeophtheirus salmonis TaxID=72036 RepID=A0A0K2UZ50_LEPSM